MVNLSATSTSPSTATILAKTVSQTGAALQVTGNGTLNVQGALNIATGGTLQIEDPATLTGSGTINLASASSSLLYQSSQDSTLDAQITGPGGVEVDSGMLTVGGVNSYSGETDVVGGTLQLSTNPNTLAYATLGAGLLTLGGAGILDLSARSPITAHSKLTGTTLWRT